MSDISKITAENAQRVHYLKCLIIQNDLKEALSVLRSEEKFWDKITHIKNAFVALHHLAEWEKTIGRPYYKDNPDLGRQFKNIRPQVEFFSYLRNKFGAHLTDDLLNKTLEWHPELYHTLQGPHGPLEILMYNIWALETAINTYIDHNGTHKIFEHEIDLNYPPDEKLFKDTLFETIEEATGFLEQVAKILQPKVEVEISEHESMRLFRHAGLTKFQFLTKKKK